MKKEYTVRGNVLRKRRGKRKKGFTLMVKTEVSRRKVSQPGAERSTVIERSREPISLAEAEDSAGRRQCSR